MRIKAGEILPKAGTSTSLTTYRSHHTVPPCFHYSTPPLPLFLELGRLFDVGCPVVRRTKQTKTTIVRSAEYEVQVFMSQPDQVKQLPLVNLRLIHGFHLPASCPAQYFVKCLLLPIDIPPGHSDKNDLKIAFAVFCNSLDLRILKYFLKISQCFRGIGEDFDHSILQSSAEHVELPVGEIPYAGVPYHISSVSPRLPRRECYSICLEIIRKGGLVGRYNSFNGKFFRSGPGKKFNSAFRVYTHSALGADKSPGYAFHARTWSLTAEPTAATTQ